RPGRAARGAGRNSLKLMLPLLLVAASALGAARADGDTPARKNAREAYAKATREADEKLLKKFDKAAEHVTNQKLPVKQRVATLDLRKAEKKRFEEKGLIPLSEPMWPYAAAYLESIRAAESRLDKGYAPEIERALRAKKDDDVRNLRAELRVALDPK